MWGRSRRQYRGQRQLSEEGWMEVAGSGSEDRTDGHAPVSRTQIGLYRESPSSGQSSRRNPM